MATRTTKTTTRKKTTTASAVTKPVTVEPVVATAETPDEVTRKKDFIDRVVERSGLKKKDVKPAVEAALAQLAEELTEGNELVVPPLGKIKINRVKDTPNGKVLITRIRLAAPTITIDEDSVDSPLAEAAE